MQRETTRESLLAKSQTRRLIFRKTFALVKDNVAGTSASDYQVLNKISDPDDREVVNGIAIVQNK